MASIRSKGAGFEARITVNGKSYSNTFKTRQEAEHWATGVKLGFIQPKTKRKALAYYLTLQEALERYETEVLPLHKGARQERYKVNQLKRHPIASMRLDHITAENIKALRDEALTSGASGSTVRLKLALLSSVFRHAQQELGADVDNPVREIRLPKPNPARKRRVSQEEIEAICQATDSKVLPIIVKLAVETAMRQSELAGLMWKNIDLTKRTALLPDTKNGEARTVPLSPYACQLLSEWRLIEPESSGRVFGITSHAIAVAFRRAVKRVCDKGGIEISDLRFHDLRHEATSRLANIFQAHEMAKITGHKDLRMLLRYYHPRAEELAKRLIETTSVAYKQRRTK